MTFGFGSEIVDDLIHTELSGVADVTAAVGVRIVGRGALVQGEPLPALLYYPEQSTYDPPAFGGDTIGMEVLRYVVRVVCLGTRTHPIRDAALAQREHLNGQAFNVVDNGQNYLVTFDAQGAFPLTTITDGAQHYRQLGTVYRVTVTLGG